MLEYVVKRTILRKIIFKALLFFAVPFISGCVAVIDEDDNIKSYGVSKEQVELILKESENVSTE